MHRVQTDVAVAANVFHLDHDQVVDMVQIFTDNFLSMSAIVPIDDQVAGGANCDLAGDMTRQDELSIIPLDFDLLTSQRLSCATQEPTYPLVPDVKVVAASVVVELSSIG